MALGTFPTSLKIGTGIQERTTVITNVFGETLKTQNSFQTRLSSEAAFLFMMQHSLHGPSACHYIAIATKQIYFFKV